MGEIARLRGVIDEAAAQARESQKGLEENSSHIEQLKGELTRQKQAHDERTAQNTARSKGIVKSFRRHLGKQNLWRGRLERQCGRLEESLECLCRQLEQNEHDFAEMASQYKRAERKLMRQQRMDQAAVDEKQCQLDRLEQVLRQRAEEYHKGRSRLNERVRELRSEVEYYEQGHASSEATAVIEELNGLLAEKSGDLEQILRMAGPNLHRPLIDMHNHGGELTCHIDDLCSSLDVNRRADVRSLVTNIRTIRSGLGQIDRVAEALCQLAGTDSGDDRPEQLNVNLVIADIIDENPRYILQGRIRFGIEEVPPCYGDAMQIKKLFAQVIDNAVRFHNATDNRNVRITGSIEENRSTYCIEDDGIGMATSDIDRAFTMFTQLDPGSSGDGIGLAVAKRIVENHKGQIAVQSQRGKGSVFSISLPTR